MTPFAVELLQSSDETGRTLIVPVVKATYDLGSGRQSPLLAVEQAPVLLTAEHWGAVETSACKYEAETAFYKPATDVALVGHAYAPRSSPGSSDVSFQLGALTKRLRVHGERVWYKSGMGITATAARPFERMPLSYDRAYGGWDRSSPDERDHHCEMRNPVGLGYRAKKAAFIDDSPLPNVEDPAKPLSSYDGDSAPAGVGFIAPNWDPRRSLTGTYDEAWMTERSPLLPKDFQRSYFNAATPGLVAQGYLRGDEPFVVRGVRPDGADLTARLPALAAPQCVLRLRGVQRALSLKTQLDTVIVNSDTNKLFLIWRQSAVVFEGLQGVLDLRITCDNAPAATEPPPTAAVISLAARRATAAKNPVKGR
jgi:hypothetical protein